MMLTVITSLVATDGHHSNRNVENTSTRENRLFEWNNLDAADSEGKKRIARKSISMKVINDNNNNNNNNKQHDSIAAFSPNGNNVNAIYHNFF